MQPYLIAPSLLAADFARLGEESQNILAAGADMLHIDVMDNHYVPNLTMGPMVCTALRRHGIKAALDVHLMTRPVDTLITAFAKAGANYISFHPEASDHVDRSLELIRSHGCKAGLALNPATSLEHLKHVMDRLDMVLIMSVNPGFGGQEFIPATLAKLKETRKLIDNSGRKILLAVDGGVKVENLHQIASAGADTFISGSAIFGQPDYVKVISAMRAELKKVG